MKKLFAILSLLALTAATARPELTVFAAASLTDALKELARTFHAQTGIPIRFNLASSGVLARQIEAGAPADVYISANTEWMDWLETRSVLQPQTRFDLAANTLVLIVPAGSTQPFDGTIDGRIAVGDFKSVPAGRYAQEALLYMGWLETLRPHLVMASNVRTALMYVERGEVEAGIVYATDAKRSAAVSVAGTFPPEAHSPIRYPAAACSPKQEAVTFLEFLTTPPAGIILESHGFIGIN